MILPDLGARIASLDLGGGPVLRTQADADDTKDWGCYPLVPWSNRIPGGLLRIDGEEHRLPSNNDDGSAIHGLGFDRPWELVSGSGSGSASGNNSSSQTTKSLRLAIAIETSPFRVRGEIAYTLAPGSLRMDLSVTNVGPSPVPVGLGIHPWFRSGPIRVPASMRWPGEPLPTGVPVPVEPGDDTRNLAVPPPMDRCLTGLVGRSAEVPGARLRWSGPIEHVVVFTGHHGWVAVEPVTMANDGFGLAERHVAGHGVHTLTHDDTLSVTFWIERPTGQRPLSNEMC